MKEKIILFIIGLLTGAVISTGAFYVFITTANKCDNSKNQAMQMPNGQPPHAPNGGNNSNSSNNGQPPEMPNEDNNSNNSQSSKQDNSNSNNT